MIRWLYLAATCLISSAVALGQQPPPLVIDERGFHQLRFDDEGAPHLVTIPVVIDRTGGELPNPEPPGDPDEPDEPTLDAELVTLAKTQAEQIDDPGTAQAIAAVYSNVRDSLSHGELSRGKVFATLRQATDKAIDECEDAADWTPFRDRLSDALAERQSRGQLETDREFLVMLASIQTGLEQSVDGAAISIDQHTQVGRITREAME